MLRVPFPTLSARGACPGTTGKLRRPGRRGVAQSGSALALGARCRRFESCLPDHFSRKALKGNRFLPLGEAECHMRCHMPVHRGISESPSLPKIPCSSRRYAPPARQSRRRGRWRRSSFYSYIYLVIARSAEGPLQFFPSSTASPAGLRTRIFPQRRHAWSITRRSLLWADEYRARGHQKISQIFDEKFFSKIFAEPFDSVNPQSTIMLTINTSVRSFHDHDHSHHHWVRIDPSSV